MDNDYIEDTIYDYVDDQPGDILDEYHLDDKEMTFVIDKESGDMSSQSLAVALGFAEEISDAEMAEIRAEVDAGGTSTDRVVTKNVDLVSLKMNTKSKVNLHQRDPHFLDYVKQICSGGNISNRVDLSAEEIF